jgi:HK97 family phage major capsid protein
MYLTNAKARGVMKKTIIESGASGMVWPVNSTELNGYGTMITNNVPSNLTKGTAVEICSAIIFGNFADLMVGFWSGLDLLVDPYTASTTGVVRVVAMQDCDLAVRHPESFAAMKDALT